MQPGTVLIFHLFAGKDSATKASELGKFLLNCLEALVPVAVSDLGFSVIAILKPILFIQILDLSNLRTETPYPFPKNIKVIHTA